MATESIFKDININTQKSAADLVDAIEKSEKCKNSNIKTIKDSVEIKGNDVKEIFKNF